jgi:hypothetical protein
LTGALLGHIETPGLELHQLMNRVRQSVLRETGNRQQPWNESSLTLDFYFVPPLAQRPPVAAAGPAPRDDPRIEVAFWESVHDGNDPRLIEEYLRQYPDGRFAALARLKLDGLRGGAAAAARTEGAPAGPGAPVAENPPAASGNPRPLLPTQMPPLPPPAVAWPVAPTPSPPTEWSGGPGAAPLLESVPLRF